MAARYAQSTAGIGTDQLWTALKQYGAARLPNDDLHSMRYGMAGASVELREGPRDSSEDSDLATRRAAPCRVLVLRDMGRYARVAGIGADYSEWCCDSGPRIGSTMSVETKGSGHFVLCRSTLSCDVIMTGNAHVLDPKSIIVRDFQALTGTIKRG